jgi:hypothetical protein
MKPARCPTTGFVHRGVAAWRDNGKLRIFINSRDWLICLDVHRRSWSFSQRRDQSLVPT